MGYVAQVTGRTEEAVKIYNQIMKQRPTDVALAAVVSNNIVTTNKVGTMSLRLSRDCCAVIVLTSRVFPVQDQNLFDSKKKMKAATASGLQSKLLVVQRQKIAINQCLLHLHSNQVTLLANITISANVIGL